MSLYWVGKEEGKVGGMMGESWGTGVNVNSASHPRPVCTLR